MKIFVAIPTFDSIYPDTYKSIYGLNMANHYAVFDFVRGYDCAVARNRIGKQAINEEADYVLMVDSDIVLPSDALINLLDEPKDVCIGLYANRNDYNVYDGNVCAYKLGEHDYKTKFSAQDMSNLRNSGHHKVQIHGGGMGCALIKTEIFKQLEYPWFKYVNYSNGSLLSEDLYFCEQCKQHNIPIYVDTRVLCGHMFRHIQWPV